MNKISNNLWIADIIDVREKTIPTDVVVGVCQDRVDDNIGCEYYHFNMADGPLSQDAYGGECSYDIVEKAINQTVEKLEDEKSVVVHCHAGQSRSASVCIGALAIVEELSYNEARKKVEKARPSINPGRELEEYVKKYITIHDTR